MKKCLPLLVTAVALSLSACSNSQPASPVSPTAAPSPSASSGWSRTQTSFANDCMSGTVSIVGGFYVASIDVQQGCVGQTLYLTSYITPGTDVISFPQTLYQEASVVLQLGQNSLRVGVPECPAAGSQGDLSTIPGQPVLEFDIYNSSNLLGYSYQKNTCTTAETNGCTLGYWKTHQPWPGGYSVNSLVSTVFSGPGIPSGYTFQAALTYAGSNKAQLLLKQAIAAVLNVASGSAVGYPLTLSQLQAQVNAALAADAGAQITLQTTLDGYNNTGSCPFGRIPGQVN